jgi:putative transport protein
VGFIDVLVDNQLLQVTIVIGLGALFGMIPFGPIKFGAAGALFVGLMFGALDERMGQDLGLLQSMGLALFVYAVGLVGGGPFVRGLRTYLPIMLISAAVLAVVAGLALAAGLALGATPEFLSGVFAGAGNSTPSLQAALDAAGNNEPSVGYSLAYPVGVAVSIAIAAAITKNPTEGSNDAAPAAAAGLVNATAAVSRACTVDDVPGVVSNSILLTMLRRDGHTSVLTGSTDLRPGDLVLAVGPKPLVEEAVEWLGGRAERDLVDDHTEVVYRRVLISRLETSDMQVSALGLEERFGAVASRIRRGDMDMLARPDSEVHIGDRIRVVVPHDRVDEVSDYLGDSERRVNELDLLTLGIGLALGILLGLPGLTVGGVQLSLGAAAGPLIVGMILGAVRQTGPFLWEIPLAANMLLRQVGVAIFLACVGLSAGRAFSEELFTANGAIGLLLALLIMLSGGLTMAFFARRSGASSARTAGLVAGYNGQPAVLAYANEQVLDERIDSGYATLFALDTVIKIVLVQLMVVLGLALT